MKPYMLIIPVMLPLITGALVPLIRFKSVKMMKIYVGTMVLINSILVFTLIFNRPEESFLLVYLTDKLSLSFSMDGLSAVFAGIVAALWPVATVFAFEYMKHEGREKKFFTFYTMSYGVTLGIAFAANLLSLYFFYELLTLITLPLVMHAMTPKAKAAGRKYLLYSMGGAAFVFVGIAYVISYGYGTDFMMYGVLNVENLGLSLNQALVIYVMMFLGFGVKAAIFPFHGWLPTASVAPTPVTALLHAVAVVKAGVFSIIRLTYYVFGTDVLEGTWAQYVVMGFAAATILFAATMAFKEQHLKRRLAYSTIGNLSYIIFTVTLMSPQGLTAAMSHMVFHAVMKITLFICIGAIIYKTHKEFVDNIYGFGQKMPVVMSCFTIGACAVVGIPFLPGFVSKWGIGTAAAANGSVMAYIGMGALLYSAVMAAIYLFTISIRAFFPSRAFDYTSISYVEDPNYLMKVPLIILCTAMVVLGIGSAPLVRVFSQIASGIF